MPFRSKAQQRFMFAKYPEIAKRWADEYGVPSNLPEHKGSKRKYLHGSGELMGHMAVMRKVGAMM